MAKGSQRGIARERAVCEWHRERGWLAWRAPASLGVCDVIALKAGMTARILEVKSSAAGPYHSFGPADRKALSEAAQKAGADALLAWWPPRGKLSFIPERDWPS